MFHGFAVADFADQNHIGRLAQRVFQCGKPVVGVYAHFALADDAAFVLVHKFNRVFDGDDVVLAVFVAVVDHRGERGGFARACAADKNHQPALFEGNLLQHGRQVEAFKRGDFAGDGAQHQRGGAALHHGVYTETAGVGQADGKIAFVGVGEFLYLLGAHDVERDFHAALGGERLFGDGHDFAVHFHGGREIGGNEKIGAFVFIKVAQPAEERFFGRLRF